MPPVDAGIPEQGPSERADRDAGWRGRIPWSRYDPRTAYRPGFVRWLTLFSWAIAVAWLYLSRGDGIGLLRQLPYVLLFLVVLPLMLFWLPRIDVDDEGIDIANVFRTIRVPFSRFDAVTTKYQLTVHTDDGRRFAIWCAPVGSGRRAIRDATPDTMAKARRVLDSKRTTIPSSELPGTDAGNASLLVGRALARWRVESAGGYESGAEPEPVVIRWHWALIGACVVAALGCIAAVVF